MDKQRKIFLKSDFLGKIYKVLAHFVDEDLLNVLKELNSECFIDLEREDMTDEIIDLLYNNFEYEDVVKFYNKLCQKCQKLYGYDFDIISP